MLAATQVSFSKYNHIGSTATTTKTDKWRITVVNDFRLVIRNRVRPNFYSKITLLFVFHSFIICSKELSNLTLSSSLANITNNYSRLNSKSNANLTNRLNNNDSKKTLFKTPSKVTPLKLNSAKKPSTPHNNYLLNDRYNKSSNSLKFMSFTD